MPANDGSSSRRVDAVAGATHERLSANKRVLLERRIHGDGLRSNSAGPQETHRERTGVSPLSVPQQQLWYFSQLVPGNPVYNESVTIRKDGRFDVNAFRLALREVVRRHEIWRTTFEVVDGQAMQVVHPVPDLELPLVDLSGMPRERAEREAASMSAAEAKRPYRLDLGPLVRPLLLRFADDHHRLYLAMHHLVFDGMSLYRIVLPELIALYDDFAAARPPSLREPAMQYGDYAVSTRESARRTDVAQRIEYWRQHLAGAPPLALPYDHPRPVQPSFRGGVVPVQVSKESAESLHSLSQEAGSTLFQALAAAFVVLLHRYSGQDDVVFGSLANLRDRTELEGMVGYCQSPIVLRTDLSDDPSFIEALRRIRTDLLDALEHLVPFERMVRELNPPRDSGINPLFQAAIVLEPPMLSPDPGWSLGLEASVGDAIGIAKFDLDLELDQRPEGHIDGRLIFNADLFERDTAQRMAGHWCRLVEDIVARPDRPVSTLPMLSEAEHRQQLVVWNATQSPYPRDACVHDLIAQQAARDPDAIAVAFGDDRLTYRELDQRASRLGHRLRAAGADAGTVVGVCLERSAGMVVGLLAILKSGAAYVPVDPRHPPDRMAYILDQAAATVVLTQRGLLSSLSQHGATLVCAEDDSESVDDRFVSPPAGGTSSDDLAYIMYTSGSTGKPKGVQVRHRNVVNLMTALRQRPGLSAADVVLAVASYSFDMSVGDIFATLGAGARLVLASSEEARDPRRLSALIQAAGATVMHATPATWQMLMDTGWPGSPTLVAVSGGDSLSRSLATALLDRCRAVWNGYGPTETTVYTTFSQVTLDAPTSVGRPIANARVYVLDRNRQPVPLGVAGEIVIGGAGVAAGYVNQPEETERRFVADPAEPGSFMYLTGDVGRYLAGGSLQHLGRLDRQVKIRGYRIEPGEIEAALLAHPGISAAVVVAVATERGDRRLVAYVVADGDAPSTAQLRTLLRRSLPPYMVPAAYIALDALPMTTSGKVDRTALPPAPVQRLDAAGGLRNPPRTALEEALSRIWSRVLDVKPIGHDDDFFDLGGHSLLAAQLLSDVERELGVRLPLSSIFTDGTTVAGMAGLIETSRSDQGGRELVVPIQPRGDAPVLFFVHPGGLTLLGVRHFTAALGPDQPVFGLLPDRIGHGFPRSQRVADIVGQMLDAVRGVQEHGPYHLAGYSLGGNLAYEIAGSLQASGERVAYLAILDAGTPPLVARRLRSLVSIRGRATVVVAELMRDPRLTMRKLGGVARRALRANLPSGQRWLAAPQDDFDWLGALRLVSTYTPNPHTVPVDLYVSGEMAMRTGSASLGWTDLHRGPLTVHSVPGEHQAMLNEPQVRLVAASLTEALRRSQEAVEEGPAEAVTST